MGGGGSWRGMGLHRRPYGGLRLRLEVWDKDSVLSDFYNFSIKITHFYAYFGQNNYLKAITHQLKAFEKQYE